MAEPESFELYLVTIPETVDDLLRSGPTHLPPEADPASIAIAAREGQSIEVAIIAMTQARLIVGSEVTVRAAVDRRNAARGLLTAASDYYTTDYTIGRPHDGRIIQERDTDKILDLYDRTEKDDDLPVLILLELARGHTGRDPDLRNTVNDADVLVRIALAGEVSLLPVLTPAPDGPSSETPTKTTSRAS